jgi:hypothetical protein
MSDDQQTGTGPVDDNDHPAATAEQPTTGEPQPIEDGAGADTPPQDASDKDDMVLVPTIAAPPAGESEQQPEMGPCGRRPVLRFTSDESVKEWVRTEIGLALRGLDVDQRRHENP